MTPRISLITAVLALALVVSVPAAFGDNWGADKQNQTTFVGSPDAIDRAIAAKQQHVATMLDARERGLNVGREVPVTQEPTGFRGDDRFRIDPTSLAVATTVSSSGRDIEWPQIGIGFGVGIALALGLLLALRATRQRPLAH